MVLSAYRREGPIDVMDRTYARLIQTLSLNPLDQYCWCSKTTSVRTKWPFSYTERLDGGAYE